MRRVHRHKWCGAAGGECNTNDHVAVSDSDDLAEALELRMKQLSADAQTLQSMDTRSVRAPPSPIDSFSSADDDDIAAALALRLDGGDGGDTEPIDDQAPLSGAAPM